MLNDIKLAGAILKKHELGGLKIIEKSVHTEMELFKDGTRFLSAMIEETPLVSYFHHENLIIL